MAVQILSDLHLETPKAYDIFEIVPRAPYLALLGDIGNVLKHKDDCLGFLRQQVKQFQVVMFVPGNHEAYGSSWDDTLHVLRDLEQSTRDDPSVGEFVLLERGLYRLPGSKLVVLGCSLFSFIPPDKQMAVEMGLNDFYQISDWTIQEHNDMHQREVAWLNAQVAELENSDARILILSHWSPSLDPRSTDPRHVGSPISSGFSTDLSEQPCFKSAHVKVWAFGHTHFNCDFVVERSNGAGPLRLVTNQRGYYSAQAKGFDAGKTVDVRASGLA